MGCANKIAKGILIGVANIVPGVSGGTLAASMGIYDGLIHAVTHITTDTKESLKTLLPYGLGAGIGILSLSFFIEFLFQTYQIQTSAVFIGLIVGGLPTLLKKTKKEEGDGKECAVFILVAAMILILTIVGAGMGEHAVIPAGLIGSLCLFLVGMIAAATMVVPGVSGTMLLMMMGYYHVILTNINRLLWSITEQNFNQLEESLCILIPFGLGVMFGIFVCAKMIELLLNHYYSLTYSAILGLVITAPFVILWEIPLYHIGVSSLISAILCFYVAYKAMINLEK